MHWIDWVKWIGIVIAILWFLKDFALMPFAIGEAKDKKDYFKTIGVGVVIIALIFGYAWFMDFAIEE